MFVDKAGDDTTGDGSETSPYLTIAKANAVAAASGRWTHITIGAGQYDEEVTVPRSHLTYQASGAVVIDGNEKARDGFVVAHASITLDGIDFQQCSIGITSSGAQTIVRNSVMTHVNTGINATGASPLVEDVEIGSFVARGVYLYNTAADDAILRRVYVHDGTGETIAYCFEAEAGADNALYEDCWAIGAKYGFIHKSSDGGIYRRCVAADMASAGFYGKGGVNASVLNCVAYDANIGITLDDDAGGDPSTGWTVKNTILASNGVVGLRAINGSDVDLDSNYNDWHGNTNVATIDATTYATLALFQAGESQDANSQVVDPDFATVVYGGFVPQAVAVLTGADDGGPQGRTG